MAAAETFGLSRIGQIAVVVHDVPTIIYYTVEDIQAAAAALQSRGVAFETLPHVVARLPHADLWMGFLRDPDNNPLALMSEVAKA